jgi:catechol 2,3-dioxygenase-like lactoylglutathione lyase family enzyme
MTLRRIDHVGVNVRDLPTSAAWYEKAFGLTVVHKWTTTWMIGCGAIRIGLFQRPKAGTIADLDNTIAISHFAFVTDRSGFDAAQARFKELNIPFDAPDDSGIAYSIFVNDPDGHQVEVTTYYKDAPPE